MESRTAATRVPDPDAAEFVRFCYRRRRVGWPELYDEMCAVAGRGLYRGYSADDLATHGIGFGLFEMPALAALANQVIAQEQALRRPVAVVITPIAEVGRISVEVAAEDAEIVAEAEPVTASPTGDPAVGTPADEEPSAPAPSLRFAPVPVGA